MNDSSIALLNLPIEADDGNESYKTKDYSPFKNNGTTLGVVFSPNTGHDGFGAYTFDGINDSISVPNSNVLDLTSNFTIELWFRGTLNVTNLLPMFVSKGGFGFNAVPELVSRIIFSSCGSTTSSCWDGLISPGSSIISVGVSSVCTSS